MIRAGIDGRPATAAGSSGSARRTRCPGRTGAPAPPGRRRAPRAACGYRPPASERAPDSAAGTAGAGHTPATSKASVAQIEAGGRVLRQVVDDHVGAVQQAPQDLPPPGFGDVEQQAFLALVDVDSQPAGHPRAVMRARALDLDDRGAVLGERPRARGAGDHRAQVDDERALQGGAATSGTGHASLRDCSRGSRSRRGPCRRAPAP